MTCPHFINAVNTSDQIVLANGILDFNTVINRGSCIKFTSGGNSFGLKCKGVYLISVDADATTTTAGAVTMQINNNGSAVTCGSATGTSNGTTPTHLHAECTVKVIPSCCCVDNEANIQIQMNEASTISNANILIERIV